jgi:hypothetical protein
VLLLGNLFILLDKVLRGLGVLRSVAAAAVAGAVAATCERHAVISQGEWADACMIEDRPDMDMILHTSICDWQLPNFLGRFMRHDRAEL